MEVFFLHPYQLGGVLKTGKDMLSLKHCSGPVDPTFKIHIIHMLSGPKIRGRGQTSLSQKSKYIYIILFKPSQEKPFLLKTIGCSFSKVAQHSKTMFTYHDNSVSNTEAMVQKQACILNFSFLACLEVEMLGLGLTLFCFGWVFFGGGAGDLKFSAYISYSWVKISLHTEC